MNAKVEKLDRIGFAISILLLGIVIVATSDLIAKSIIPYVSVWLLLFLRSLCAFIFLIALLFFLKKLPSIKALNFKAVLCRSLLMSACYICFYLALANISIAIAAGAFFCGPFFMALLSRLMLGETFGIWRSISLIIGFLGIVLILQPNSVAFDFYVILALLSAFLYALTQVVTRKYCKKEDPVALSCWLTLTFLVTGLIGVIVLALIPSFNGASFIDRPNVVVLPLFVFLIICFLGILSIVIHYALSAAYQNAPAGLLGPLEYIYLPIAILGGYLFYDEIPNLTAFVGIIIIIAAGLIIAWRKDIH